MLLFADHKFQVWRCLNSKTAPMRVVLTVALWCSCTFLWVGADESVELRRRATAPTGRILKLVLMDADKDQPIAAFDPLLPYSLINVGTLPTTNLNIEAITEGEVGSIQWNFGSFVRNENCARWSFCGNAGSDFYQCRDTLKVGVNATLTGTPYSGRYATGTKFPSYSIKIAIISSAAAPAGQPIAPPVRSPTAVPTALPMHSPTKAPVAPAKTPTTPTKTPVALSKVPTKDPVAPTKAPVASTKAPVAPTKVPVAPTKAPVAPTKALVVAPSKSPVAPTKTPVSPPASAPLASPRLASPRLLNFTLISPSTLNVSAGSAIGRMRIVAQDDESVLVTYAVRAVRTVLGEGNAYLSARYDFVGQQVAGQPSTGFADLTFPSFAGNGNYLLQVYLESKRNFTRILPAELARRGFSSQFTVVGSTFMTGYLLSFASNTPATVDISKTAASFSFTAKLNRGPYVITTGSMSLVAESSYGSSDIYFGSQSDPWEARTFHFFRSIDSPKPGVYSLRLSLTLEGVFTEYLEADLVKLGFPSTITISQSGPFPAPVSPPPTRRRVILPPDQV
jgi:hypothetical protein